MHRSRPPPPPKKNLLAYLDGMCEILHQLILEPLVQRLSGPVQYKVRQVLGRHAGYKY